MAGSRLSGDDLLWNWARWCWKGGVVGNMGRLVFEDEEEERASQRPVLEHQAMQVEAMHSRLPHHERMVIIAEYPQRHAMFGGQTESGRRAKAIRWIANTTAVHLTDAEYKLYLGLFRHQVEREVR